MPSRPTLESPAIFTTSSKGVRIEPFPVGEHREHRVLETLSGRWLRPAKPWSSRPTSREYRQAEDGGCETLRDSETDRPTTPRLVVDRSHTAHLDRVFEIYCCRYRVPNASPRRLPMPASLLCTLRSAGSDSASDRPDVIDQSRPDPTVCSHRRSLSREGPGACATESERAVLLCGGGVLSWRRTRSVDRARSAAVPSDVLHECSGRSSLTEHPPGPTEPIRHSARLPPA